MLSVIAPVSVVCAMSVCKSACVLRSLCVKGFVWKRVRVKARVSEGICV